MAELRQLKEVLRPVGRQYHRQRCDDPGGIERVPQRLPDPPQIESECASIDEWKQYVYGREFFCGLPRRLIEPGPASLPCVQPTPEPARIQRLE